MILFVFLNICVSQKNVEGIHANVPKLVTLRIHECIFI